MSRLGVWLGLLPFALFALAFMVLPTAGILLGSFQDAQGAFTLENLRHLLTPDILACYAISLKISLVTALAGTVFGFLLAYSVTMGGLPRTFRPLLVTFSGVASNFSGVPLSFAFIATLGRVGLVTTLADRVFGVRIYAHGFNLYGFYGLSLTYLYFQLPLMVLIITPALDRMKREWWEASQSLGASRTRYWLHVGLPVMAPSLLSALILLFGNAFGAYATAYALTGGLLNLVPIVIGAQIQGDVLHDPNLAYALALGMVVVMAACALLNTLVRRSVSRWLP